MHRAAVEGIIDAYVNKEVSLPVLTVTRKSFLVLS